jgi:predicted phosphodiesterase
MEVKKYQVESQVCLAPIGDFHIGSKACQKKKLEEDLKWLKKSNYKIMLMGDMLDNISPILKPEYFYSEEIDPELTNLRDCLNYLKWLLIPLKDQLIGLHVGNHDFDLIRKIGYDYIKQICEELHTNYLGFEAFTDLLYVKGEKIIKVFSTHGHYVGRRIGGKVNRIEDLSGFFDADIYLMGHTHELAGWRRIALSTYNGEIIQKKKIYALTGTYLLSHGKDSTYAERHGLLPNKIGMLSIEINLKTHDMHIKE